MQKRAEKLEYHHRFRTSWEKIRHVQRNLDKAVWTMEPYLENSDWHKQVVAAFFPIHHKISHAD